MKSQYCLNYIYIITFCGFVYLLILSFFAFFNSEVLKIKKNKHKNSGIILLINSLVYLAISIYLKHKGKKERKLRNE